MLIDSFTFFQERDILLLRLETLYRYVDKFVLVEGNTTHSGAPRELVWADNLRHEEDFAPFLDKIIYKTAQLNLIESDWGREGHQRDLILDCCTPFPPSAHLMVSDADEIPDPKTAFVKGTYKQAMRYFYLNVEATYPWYGTVCETLGFWRANGINNIRRALHRGSYVQPVVENGGWHFSAQGGPEMVHNKLSSYAHQEYNTAEVHAALESRMIGLEDMFGRGEQYDVVDDSFPPVNLEPYKHLLYHK